MPFPHYPLPGVPTVLTANTIDWFYLLLNVMSVESCSCVLFCVWLLSLNILLMKSIHVVACSCSLFILISGKYSIVWIHHSLLTHFTVDEYLSSFQFLAIKSNAAMNVLMPDFWRAYMCVSVGNIPKSGMIGSWGIHTLVDTAHFPSNCTNLCSH